MLENDTAKGRTTLRCRGLPSSKAREISSRIHLVIRNEAEITKGNASMVPTNASNVAKKATLPEII